MKPKNLARWLANLNFSAFIFPRRTLCAALAWAALALGAAAPAQALPLPQGFLRALFAADSAAALRGYLRLSSEVPTATALRTLEEALPTDVGLSRLNTYLQDRAELYGELIYIKRYLQVRAGARPTRPPQNIVEQRIDSAGDWVYLSRAIDEGSSILEGLSESAKRLIARRALSQMTEIEIANLTDLMDLAVMEQGLGDLARYIGLPGDQRFLAPSARAQSGLRR